MSKGQAVLNVMVVMRAKLFKILNFSKVQIPRENILFVKKSTVNPVFSFTSFFVLIAGEIMLANLNDNLGKDTVATNKKSTIEQGVWANTSTPQTAGAVLTTIYKLL